MKLNISDEILAEIGKIVITHNLIESSLSNIIGTIISLRTHEEIGQIVTAELSFRQKIPMLRSLLVLCLTDKHESVAEFDKIKGKLHEADSQRNIIVHSNWFKSEEHEHEIVIRSKTTAKEKHGLRCDSVEMNLQEIEAISDLIADAYLKICMFELQFQHSKEEPEPVGTGQPM